MFDLRKFLEGAVAQVNPWDNGKNWDSVYNARPQQPQRQQPQQQQRPQPQQRIAPNPLLPKEFQMPQQRQQTPQPQQPKVENLRQGYGFAGDVGNFVKGVAQGFGDSINTVGNSAAATTNFFINQANGSNAARQNEISNRMRTASEAQKAATGDFVHNQVYKDQQLRRAQGDLNIANTLRRQQQAATADVQQNSDPIKTGAASLNILGTVALPGVGKVAGAIGEGLAPFARPIIGKVLGGMAEGGIIGTGFGAANQLQQTGVKTNPNDLINAAPQNFGMGAAFGGAIPAAIPVVKGAINVSRKAGQQVSKAIDDVQPKTIAAQHPEVLGHDPQYSDLGKSFDTTVDPVARRQISQAMADNRLARLETQRRIERQIVNSRQSGSVPAGNFDPTGRLGKEPVLSTPDPLANLKQEAPKYKSAEEFVNNTSKTPESIPVTKGYNESVAQQKSMLTRADEALNEYRAIEKTAKSPEGQALSEIEKGKLFDKYQTLVKERESLLSKGTRMKHPETPVKTHIGDKALKQQLTDIYNQANKPVMGETPTVKPSKGVGAETVRVYHGTTENFDKLKISTIDGRHGENQIPGIYTTPHKETASMFAEHPVYGTSRGALKEGDVTLNKPLRFKDYNDLSEKLGVDINKRLVDVPELAKSKGYDGLIREGGIASKYGKADEYILFSPDQLKPAQTKPKQPLSEPLPTTPKTELPTLKDKASVLKAKADKQAIRVLQAIDPTNPLKYGRLNAKEKALFTEAKKAQAPPVTSNATSSELPVNGTKRVSNIDKIFRSTRSIVERQGEHGKVLAGNLQKARDIEELYQADLLKRMPAVTKLAKDYDKVKNLTNKDTDYNNFVEATQGLAKPRNTAVEQAVKEWQAVHPEIRNRAVAAGLDVGDLGKGYYPHFIDYEKIFKDKNTYNEAVNHLVKSGQAKSNEDAIKLLSYARDTSRNRTFGNLEASRLVDLPFYDKSPNSFRQYLQSSTRRTAQTEIFGAKDEKALKLITKAGNQGYDTEAMKNAYDVAVGAKKYNQPLEDATRIARRYTTTTRLGLGALTNASQTVNTGIVTGHLRTMGAVLKQFDKKTRSFVADTGTISDAVLNDLRTQKGTESFGATVAGKVVNKITAPGFSQVESFNRSVAATAGRDWANTLAKRGDARSLAILRDKLNVSGEIKNGKLSYDQQVQAARKIVEKTQFKVDPQDLPGWVDSPGGKLVAQFRTFSYAQGKFFSNEILKPAAKGNLLPLGRVLAALPVGYGLYELRRNIDGRPEEEDKTKVAIESFSKIGGAGLVVDMYRGINPVNGKYLPADRRVSMAAGTVGGPTVGTAIGAVGAISEAVQQKNIPKTNPTLEGKVAVKNGAGDKYNDLTSLSRLGIKQIPVVGSPIANRVIPYKKQVEADTGVIAQKSNAIKDKQKERSAAFKSSLSADDYTISQMSKKDQQSLVSDGTISQKKLDGLNNYVTDKKKELGYNSGKSSKTDTGWADEYKTAQDTYNKDNASWSPVTRSTKEKELRQLTVKKDYSKDTTNLYDMAKKDVYQLVSKDPNGQKYVDDILKYGDALVAAGLTDKNKYRDKYGNVLLNDGTKSGGKGRRVGKGSRGGKAKTAKLPTINTAASTDTFRTLSRLLAGTTAKSTQPKQIGRKVVLKKITRSQA